LFSTTEDLT